MTHYWRLRATLPERHGMPCRIVATGRLNSICIEFEDGVRHIVNRYAVRRLAEPIGRQHEGWLGGV
jgi:hypothetical protein